MIIFKKVQDLRHYLDMESHKKQAVGFVPTMGALHAGHRSLIEKSKKEGHIAVCSIFVNPTQFNDKNDFEKYPVSVEDDIALLVSAGCDVLFLPPAEEIYPEGTENTTTYDFGYLDTILEGAKRPGHFRGVGQVVARLINIVQPQYLYLGQKDLQQCMVIKDLVKQMGKEKELQVVICKTVREPDGLALSSRNRRLTEPQRAIAGIIYQCLVSIQTKQGVSHFDIVKKECEDLLRDKGLNPEYISLADAGDMDLLDEYDPSRPTAALIAAWLGGVRLIDNLMLTAE